MNRVSASYRGIAREFAKQAVRQLDGDIHAIVLYGSVARGEASDESDIDLLVLTPNKQELDRKVVEIELEVAAEHGYQTFPTSVYLSPEEVRHLATIGSPFIRNVLEEGVALYDDGSFSRLRKESHAMAMKPSHEFKINSLRKADEMLANARLMFQHDQLASAADRAYYAMFHAATAVLSREVPRLPKTHGGMRTLFAQHLVATGKVDASASRDLADAFELGQDSTYEVGSEPSEDKVRELIGKAEAFVAKMRELLGMEEPTGPVNAEPGPQ